ncbi:uncharacterized protein [Spinacia oleracea]|uniref:Reverse transcriptase zinc-binding domain-containing protein n=1 Tax=Spinacia oleracea TaxID=3562 RepID=A0A9R0HYR6_SPIOL|nr:uncharacterized protein LOC110779093 [Spinacia oleracea]
MSSLHNVASDASFPSASWWKHFWGLNILPKLKVFFWKLLRHGLPLASVLQKRGLPVDPTCSFCHLFPEDAEHLFRDCPLIHQFWASSPVHLFLPSASGSPESWCLAFMSNCSSASSRYELFDHFIVILWSTWILRNNVRFRDASWDPGALMVLSTSWKLRCFQARVATRFSSSRARCSLPDPVILPAQLEPGDCAVCCLISDGAWDSSTNAAGLGWILKDIVSLGCSGGGAQACVLGSAFQAELSACLWGLRIAIRRGFTGVLLLTDSAVLVNLLSTSQDGPTAVTWALQELRGLISSLAWFSAQKVSRQTVSPAHLLASSARRRHLIRHRF